MNIVPADVEVDEAMMAEANALKEQANALFIQKLYPQAIDLYSHALTKNPHDAYLYSNRCAAYLAAGEPRLALQDVRISKQVRSIYLYIYINDLSCVAETGLGQSTLSRRPMSRSVEAI
jgi:serine/threonine-protein phosphatase 5